MQSSSVIYMYLPLVFYIRFLYFHIQCKGKKCRERLAFTTSLQMFSSHKWNCVQLYWIIAATLLHWNYSSKIYHIIVITVHKTFHSKLIQVFNFFFTFQFHCLHNLCLLFTFFPLFFFLWTFTGWTCGVEFRG